MKKIKIILLAITITFTFTACGTGEPPEVIPPAAADETESITATSELTVWGMTCVRCENKIKNVLLKIDGVIDVFADASEDKVTIIHDPELDIDIINSIITGEGLNIP
ncbi:MAG: heavy-metal-associated domain-containing protein [Oscillospiraceae bacterium]|nr:heavy-metal-associated domain-containing protein [Oscillospiraceae bacterium]